MTIMVGLLEIQK